MPVMSSKLTNGHRDVAGHEQSISTEFNSDMVMGEVVLTQSSLPARPSSIRSSNQGSVLDPSPPYAISLHEETRGYEYSGPVPSTLQGPEHHLGAIRLVPHNPESEIITTWLGSATRYLDLADLPTATPEQIQQLRLQSRMIATQKTLQSSAVENRDISPTKSFTARTGDRQFTDDFRVVVVGPGGVDKSALVIQFIHSTFVDEYDPTIDDSYRKSITVDDTPAILDILDTAGQEEYSAMREQYSNSGEGFVLVYSITSRASFLEIQELSEEIHRVRKTDAWPRVLVANHCDRESERVIPQWEGRELAERFECDFYETSTKTGVNVDAVFEAIVREIRVHDLMGLLKVFGSTRTDPSLNLTSRRQRVPDDTIFRIVEEADALDQNLQKTEPKRTTNYFRRRSKKATQG